MPQIVGIVKVHIDNEIQRSNEGAKLSLGGFERTMVTGHSVYGFTQKVVPSMVEFTISHTADDDLIALSKNVNSTVRFETDVAGVSYVCTGMVVTKVLELTGGSGEVTVEMQGNPADKEG